MSQEKQLKDTEKAIEKLSNALEIEQLQENEAGELTGGFSSAMSAESEDILEVNLFKCHCTVKEEAS